MSFQTASDVLVETLMKQIAHLALARNANVQSEDPATVIRAIVEGVQTAQTTARPTASTMPSYGWKLSDAQIAAVATYVRNAWGQRRACGEFQPGEVAQEATRAGDPVEPRQR